MDNTKHHRVYTKLNVTNYNKANNHQRHHVLSPLDTTGGIPNPSSLEYDVETTNDNDNVQTIFQHMDISIDDLFDSSNNKHQSSNYNDYEIFDQYHDRLSSSSVDKADVVHSFSGSGDDDSVGNDGGGSGSDSNGIVGDAVSNLELYGKRKIRHAIRGNNGNGRGDGQQLGVCPSNVGANDGYTIADKTRQYKLCEPVYKLPQCRFVYNLYVFFTALFAFSINIKYRYYNTCTVNREYV